MESADFLPVSRLQLSVGWERMREGGTYGSAQRLFQKIPIGIRYGLARNVQLGLIWPLVAVDNLRTPAASLPIASGDLFVDMAFAREDAEYDYREAFLFRTRIPDASPTVRRDLRLSTAPSDYERDSLARDYFPLVFHNTDFSLGWAFTKKIAPRTRLSFSFRYVYELNTNETLTNVFALGGFIEQNPSNAQNTAGFSNFEGANLSLFGLEKVFQRLFWTTSLTDPWADKINDHVEAGLSIDTTFDLEYDFGLFRLRAAMIPFAELFGVWRFSEASLARSRLAFSGGFVLDWGGRFRNRFAFTRILWAENRQEWEDAFRMQVSMIF